MAQVSIVMGSDSDMPVMAKAAEILDKFGISYEMRIYSCTSDAGTFFEYAQDRGGAGRKGDYRRRRYGSSSARVCALHCFRCR